MATERRGVVLVDMATPFLPSRITSAPCLPLASHLASPRIKYHLDTCTLFFSPSSRHLLVGKTRCVVSTISSFDNLSSCFDGIHNPPSLRCRSFGAKFPAKLTYGPVYLKPWDSPSHRRESLAKRFRTEHLCTRRVSSLKRRGQSSWPVWLNRVHADELGNLVSRFMFWSPDGEDRW